MRYCSLRIVLFVDVTKCPSMAVSSAKTIMVFIQFNSSKKTMLKIKPDRYGIVAQTFHWATAVLVLIAFIYGLGGNEMRVYDAAHDFQRMLHETLGMSVLALVVLRLLWRMLDTRPAPTAAPHWMGMASKAVHGLLYALLLALPLTAIFGAWLEGHPLTLLVGVNFVSPLPMAHALGESLAEFHTLLGDAIMILAGLHAAAAIYHHLVLRDGVLKTMLPVWLKVWQPSKRWF
jgi:cytochrome b561